ncbi:MAG: hypothetical protein HQK57_13560 [Deltaproteobacteria bacterium]|nr:hypothetical protein [Deltaproteobacteria bacterium]
MFQSTVKPVESKGKKAINRDGWAFYDRWCAKCVGRHEGKRPRVSIQAFKDDQGNCRTVFIDLIRIHFKTKNPGDTARRLRLLPCVFDLLENSEDVPIAIKDKAGKSYALKGMTPDGEKFIVVIQEKKDRLSLLTFYPATNKKTFALSD